MLRDVYWRQYPVDLLSDDKMACVEAMLPDDQKHIPYMIYIAALKLCDNDGVFDVDDGVVLARLTRVKDVKTVLNIVNLMRQRKILFRLFDNSTLCGLVDWTYSEKDKKVRTIEERRKLVAERIQKEQTRAGVDKDFTLPGEERTAPSVSAPQRAAPAKVPDFITKCKTCEAYDAAENACTDPTAECCQRHWKPAAPVQEAETAPAPQDFLYTENDKNAENVVISGMDDKNAENVVTLQDNTVQDNKTIQTNRQNIQTYTHTQQQATGSALPVGAPPVTCQDTNAVGVENIQSINTETPDTPTDGEAECDSAISSLAEMALREAGKGDEEIAQASLTEYLNEFFVKNCYGFKKNQAAGAINELIGKIFELCDEENPPATVASVMCSEFKKMCEGQRGKHWKDMPLLPARMINPNVWAVLCQNAGKILATNKNSNKFMAAAQKAQEECEAEKDLVSVAMREEYLKYNINPDDPNAQKLLLVAKSQEQKARKAEDEEFEIF